MTEIEKMPPVTRHYLFDFDGTLVDSMPYWADTMLRVLDHHGISYPENIIQIITPLGLRATAEHFITMGLDRTVDEILDEIASHLTQLYRNVIPAKETVEQTLRTMKSNGYGLHVLTASPHRWLDPCLCRLGLLDLFDNVWSSDDFGTTKTNPDIYVQAASRIGTTVDNVTFLDDNVNADQTAKRAGMYVIGVYDDSSKNDEALMRQITDGYIHRFSDLETLILKKK